MAVEFKSVVSFPISTGESTNVTQIPVRILANASTHTAVIHATVRLVTKVLIVPLTSTNAKRVLVRIQASVLTLSGTSAVRAKVLRVEPVPMTSTNVTYTAVTRAEIA